MGRVPKFKFGKDQRLLKASEFQEVFDLNTFKISHPNWLLLAKFNGDRESRLGLVIGKKNIPTAVGRNFIKRLVRETFRKSDLPHSIDVIFLARKGADKLSARDMALLLQESWCRLRQRCNDSKAKNA